MPRLPRSSVSRNAIGHLRLLTDVDLYGSPYLQFFGKMLRPGGIFEIEDLPRPAVLLECAGSVRTAPARSRYSFHTLYVLWSFDFDASEWHEELRGTTRDMNLIIDFAPVAHRLLYAIPRPLAQDRVMTIVRRLAILIDEDLAEISTEERCAALAGIEMHIANEIVHATERMPAESEWARRLSAIA